MHLPDFLADAVLKKLGGDSSSTIATFAHIPEGILTKSIESVIILDDPITPMLIGKVMEWHIKAKEMTTKPATVNRPGSSNDRPEPKGRKKEGVIEQK